MPAPVHPLPDLSPRHAWQLAQCSRDAENELRAHRVQLLTELRDLGWTNYKLAKLLGISRQAVSQYLRVAG